MTYHVSRDELLATVVIPAGTYYLGDPCYSVPDHLWMEWLQAAKYETEHVLDAEVRGHRVLGFGTLYGDGVYRGSDGFDYPVDAGLIGLVPESLVLDRDANPAAEPRYPNRIASAKATRADFRDNMLCRIVKFTGDTVCQYERGLLRFGDITIDTRDEED